MPIYDSRRGDRGRVFDGTGAEVPSVIRVETETGAATQTVRDGQGRPVVRILPPMSKFGLPETDFEDVAVPDPSRPTGYREIRRRAVVETREITLSLPVRFEPLRQQA